MISNIEGPMRLNVTDFSSSDSSMCSSSSDEDKKITRKTRKGKDHKYRPADVMHYLDVKPRFRKKTEQRIKIDYLNPMREERVNHDQGSTISRFNIPVKHLTEKEAFDAVKAYIHKKGGNPALVTKLMTLYNVRNTRAMIYRCEVFYETRKVMWKTEPYEDPSGEAEQKAKIVEEPLDRKPSRSSKNSCLSSRGPSDESVAEFEVGHIPKPWSVVPPVNTLWKNITQCIEIPYSQSIRKCWYCKGRGETRCRYCRGCRFLACRDCRSTGESCGADGYSTCVTCLGSGEEKCFRCAAVGSSICKVCNQRKKLRWSLQCVIKRKTVLDDNPISAEMKIAYALHKAEGKPVYYETGLSLRPMDFLEERVSVILMEALQRLEKRCQRIGRILCKSQSLIAIDLCKANWKFAEFERDLLVLGTNRAVHFPDCPLGIPAIFK